jgi:hypothetical protein
MKIKHKLLVLLAITILILPGSKLFAQADVAIFLRGNKDDAVKLANAYMKPFGNMFGNSLNGGWYNSAKPHGLFGFDITFNATIAMAPSSDKMFDVTKLGLTSLTPADPLQVNSPSIAGSKNAGPSMNYTQIVPGAGTFSTQFNLPKGAGLTMVPMPMIQLSVGLPMHTEIIGRYFPTVDIPKVGKFGMWGVGVKNEFKEFIPGLKALPINISLILGYTNLTSEFNVDYKPQYYPTLKTAADYSNQTLNLSGKGYTARLLVGKSIPVLTVYAGVGYSKSKTNFDLKGNYPFGLGNDGGTIKIADNYDWQNPLALSFSDSGMSLNAGLRIKLTVISFHFDYTLGKYKLINAGVGINFR